MSIEIRTTRRSALTILSSSFLILALNSGLHATADDPDPDLTVSQIVEAAIEASGGKALDALESVKREGEMKIESGLFGNLEGTWELAYLPGKKGFQEADFTVAATATGWDGKVGWEDSAGGLRELPPQEVGINRTLWEINVLHSLARDGLLDKVERLADESIDDTAHYVLRYTAGSDFEMKVLVDPTTFLITRTETPVQSPQLGNSFIRNDYSSYASREGVMFPERIDQVFEGVWVIETTYTKTEVNVELQESLFAKPGSAP